MRGFRPRHAFGVLTVAALLLVAPAAGAQNPEAAPDTPARAAAAPEPDEIEASLAAAKEDSGLDEPVKASVTGRYEEALALAEKAAEARDRAARHRAALAGAPERKKQLEAALEALDGRDLPPETTLPPPGAPAAEIEAVLGELRAEADALHSRLRALNSELEAEKTRPASTLSELDTAREAVSALPAPTTEAEASDTSPAAVARRTLEAARRAELEATVAALQQETASYDARLDTLRAEAALLERRAELADAAAAQLAQQRQSNVVRAAAEARATAEAALADTGQNHPVVAALAEEIAAMAKELSTVAARTTAFDAARRAAEKLESDLNARLTAIQAHPLAGDTPDLPAAVLLDMQAELPAAGPYRDRLRERADGVRDAHARAYEIGRELRGFGTPEEAASRVLDTPGPGGETPAGDDALRAATVTLAAQKLDLLQKLDAEYGLFVRASGRLASAEKAVLSVLTRTTAFLDEQLFWVRSAPPLDADALRSLPAGAGWALGPARAPQLAAALATAVRQQPVFSTLSALLLMVLLVFRRKLGRRLAHVGNQTRRISSDHYVYTLRALLLTAALALPAPFALWAVGTALSDLVDEPGWVAAVAAALRGVVPSLFAAMFLISLARPGGLADAHFRWSRDGLRHLRRHLGWAVPAAVFCALLVRMTFWGDEGSVHRNTFGRLAVIAQMGVLSVAAHRLLHPERGLFAGWIKRKPDGWLARTRAVWFSLAWGLPLALAVLAGLGFTYAVLALIEVGGRSLGVIAANAVGFGLVLRWFSMRRRRLALAQALEKRRARQQAGDAPPEAVRDDLDLPEVEVRDEPDLASMQAQSRSLLLFLLALSTGFGLWSVWTDAVPRFAFLEAIPAAGSLSLGALLAGVLVLVVTVVAAKNLPGLLEIAVLQHLPIASGTRYALVTLCQYIVILVGVVVAFHRLGLELSQLGWMLAALSVGLGFGLQEVVANFVSGLILLFERPIRVGDVVTVGDTTGVVSRIQIRATTITNWDRQELLVPNKEFITGRVLNWTLSNTTNRVVVNVGVAYGSDTGRVLALLGEIAGAHPNVLDDPAPIVTFETFGASSLDFALRCYIPGLENRLATLTDLHSSIHQRFGEEGIEIAFPQLDVHLKRGPGGNDGGAGGETR